jgi:hypothetical protein
MKVTKKSSFTGRKHTLEIPITAEQLVAWDANTDYENDYVYECYKMFPNLTPKQRETNRANEIIVEVLQSALAGQLDPSSNVNPRFIAEAIAAKVNFEKTYDGLKGDKVASALVEKISALGVEMTEELDKLTSDQKMLENFIRGKLTAYTEILAIFNTL